MLFRNPIICLLNTQKKNTFIDLYIKTKYNIGKHNKTFITIY